MYISSKMRKQNRKQKMSYGLPDSADRSVPRRRYYRNSREIMGLQETNKNYSNLVSRTSEIIDFADLPRILYKCSRIFPYITVRDRGGTAIYTSTVHQAGSRSSTVPTATPDIAAESCRGCPGGLRDRSGPDRCSSHRCL